jgi:hypothetical protein
MGGSRYNRLNDFDHQARMWRGPRLWQMTLVAGKVSFQKTNNPRLD